MDKAEARRTALLRRDALGASERAEADAAIRNRFTALAEFKSAGCVMLFASFRSEVDTKGIIEDALSADKRVVLPKIVRGKAALQLLEIKGLKDMAPGYMGIPEPQSGKEVAPSELDLIAVPGAAFDTQGGRIGYGGGYYDRLLTSTSAMTVALAYEAQMMDRVPREGHDVLIRAIVTERRYIDCDG